MRLLELRSPGAESPSLEFHPYLTIVRGLSSEDQDVVIRAIAAIASGSDPGLGGLVESHGIIFDLSPETLGIFGLDSAVDVVVRQDDLPGGNGSSPAGVHTPATEDNGLAVPALDSADANPELAESLDAYRDAKEAHEVMVDALERARLERDAAGEARQRIMTALEKARRDRDLARARRDAPEGEGLDPGADRELAERVEQMGERHSVLSEAIAQLEEQDPRSIEVLLEAINQPRSTTMVPSEDAIALADDFVVVQQHLDAAERRLQADGMSMDEMIRRLDDARVELSQAEKAMAKPELSSEDVTELEAAHEEVMEAEMKASGRMGRKAALKRLEEAQAKEREILDRVGFPTWASYIMGASLLNIDPVAEQRLEQARLTAEQANAEWMALNELLEADPEYSELIDRFESVVLAAIDILGGEPEGDLEEALRSHTIVEEEISRQDLIDALIYQLGLRGVEVPEFSPDDVAVSAAASWLESAADHWQRYTEHQHELATLEAEMGRIEEELAGRGVVGESNSPEERERAYEQAEAAVAEILADLEQASELEVELDGQVEARELLLTPADLALRVAEAAWKEAAAASAAVIPKGTNPPLPPSYDRKPEVYDDLPYAAEDEGAGEAAPGEDREEVEFFFLSRLATLRNLSHAGSVPLVIDDALAGRPQDEVIRLMGSLERMAESVQVIYLTDDETIIEWTDRLGFQRAAVVEPIAGLSG